jgi:hypothetical protein
MMKTVKKTYSLCICQSRTTDIYKNFGGDKKTLKSFLVPLKIICDHNNQ